MVWRKKMEDVQVSEEDKIGEVLKEMEIEKGQIWGKKMWGKWWVWDERIKQVFVIFIMYIGIIEIQREMDEKERREKKVEVIKIVGLINVKIIKLQVDWWNKMNKND